MGNATTSSSSTATPPHPAPPPSVSSSSRRESLASDAEDDDVESPHDDYYHQQQQQHHHHVGFIPRIVNNTTLALKSPRALISQGNVRHPPPLTTTTTTTTRYEPIPSPPPDLSPTQSPEEGNNPSQTQPPIRHRRRRSWGDRFSAFGGGTTHHHANGSWKTQQVPLSPVSPPAPPHAQIGREMYLQAISSGSSSEGERGEERSTKKKMITSASTAAETEEEENNKRRITILMEHESRCADCREGERPTWVSLTHGVFVCLPCAGAHRSLPDSRIRSVKLDDLTSEQIDEVELKGGNDVVNAILEGRILSEGKNAFERYKPDSRTCSSAERRRFIQDKYVRHAFVLQPQREISPKNLGNGGNQPHDDDDDDRSPSKEEEEEEEDDDDNEKSAPGKPYRTVQHAFHGLRLGVNPPLSPHLLGRGAPPPRRQAGSFSKARTEYVGILEVHVLRSENLRKPRFVSRRLMGGYRIHFTCGTFRAQVASSDARGETWPSEMGLKFSWDGKSHLEAVLRLGEVTASHASLDLSNLLLRGVSSTTEFWLDFSGGERVLLSLSFVDLRS